MNIRNETNSTDQHQFLSSDSVDRHVEYDDTSSDAYTSCSDFSNNVCNFESSELDRRPCRSNFIENIEPANANIGSVRVENSANVTFGNKTYFNGPVIIKHLTVDGSSMESTKTPEENDQPLKNSKFGGC